MKTLRIDPQADFNAEHDEGRNWSLMRNARAPGAIVPGAVVIAGHEGLWSVVRIDEVDDDGQVHFVQLDHEDPPPARCSRPRELMVSRARRGHGGLDSFSVRSPARPAPSR